MAEQKKTTTKVTPIAKVEAPKAEAKKIKATAGKAAAVTKPAATKAAVTSKVAAAPKTAAKPAATKSAVKEEVTVRFDVSLYGEALNAAKIFIVGNIAALGSWDVSKGLAMKSRGNGQFEAAIKLPVNTDVEYKVCNCIDWNGVEKGLWGEELENHSFKACKDSLQIIGVSKWRE